MMCFLNWLYTVLNRMGINFANFVLDKNERIKAQKYCYLLNKFLNLPINGAFSLYINGPYNSKLADILYEITRCNNLSTVHLDSNVENIINIIINIFPYNKENVVNELEIFTTYDFLCNNYPNLTDSQRMSELFQLKGHLTGYSEFISNLNQIEQAFI